MKERIKIETKILSLLLVFSLVLSVIPMQANAETEATQSTPQTYGEWKDVVPANGNFEVGVEDQDVYGWSLTSTDYSANIDTSSDWTENYTLKTEVEGVNKVAAFSRKGMGYAAMTSQTFPVEADTAYRLSYDYFTQDYTLPEDGEFDGICVVVQQFNEDGEQISWKLLSKVKSGIGQTASTTWDTKCYDFVTDAGATSAKIYIRIGGYKDYKVTVLIDNVTIKNYELFDVPNGDFSGTTNDADGGRKDTTILGPGGWTSKSLTSAALDDDDNMYHNYHIASLEQDNEKGQVLKYMPVGGRGHGLAIVQSPYIPAVANAAFSIQYDCKITGSVTDPSHFTGTDIRIAYYNAKKELITTQDGTQFVNYQNNKNTATAEWKTMTYTGLSTPEGTAYVKVGITFRAWDNESATMDLAVYVDNISLQVTSASAAGWKLVAKTQNQQGTVDSNYKVSYQSVDGMYEEGTIKVHRGQTWWDANLVTSEYNVEPQERYSLSIEYQLRNLNNVKNDLSLELYVEQYDENNALISTGNVLKKTVAPEAITEWMQYPTYEFETAENVAYCKVYLGLHTPKNGAYNNQSCGYDFYVRNATLKSENKWEFVAKTTSKQSEVDKNCAVSYQGVEGTYEPGTIKVHRGQIWWDADLVTSEYNVEPQERYSLSIEYQLRNLNNVNKDLSLELYVEQYDENNALISTGNVLKKTVAPEVITEWTKYPTYEFETVENVAYCKVYLGLHTPNENGLYNNQSCGYDFYVKNATLISENENSTDLLFVMLKGGNATDDAEGIVDVCDLVRMKKNINTATTSSGDMNKNQKFDLDDIKLLCWKLVGICNMDDLNESR